MKLLPLILCLVSTLAYGCQDCLDNPGNKPKWERAKELTITSSYLIYTIIDQTVLEEWLKKDAENKYLLYIEVTDNRKEQADEKDTSDYTDGYMHRF